MRINGQKYVYDPKLGHYVRFDVRTHMTESGRTPRPARPDEHRPYVGF